MIKYIKTYFEKAFTTSFNSIKVEKAKKVITTDNNNVKNGFLIELGKKENLTTSYLTCVEANGFKGYHMHRVRTANYVCIRGKCVIELATALGWRKVELNADSPQRLHIPINIPTGLVNCSDEDCWIINVPEPAYDPELKDEQVDFTLKEVEKWMKEQRFSNLYI